MKNNTDVTLIRHPTRKTSTHKESENVMLSFRFFVSDRCIVHVLSPLAAGNKLWISNNNNNSSFNRQQSVLEVTGEIPT